MTLLPPAVHLFGGYPVLVAQSCPTLQPHAPLGSSVHGILQARKLKWVAIYSSRGSSRLRDGTGSLMFPALARRFFIHSTTWEAQLLS